MSRNTKSGPRLDWRARALLVEALLALAAARLALCMLPFRSIAARLGNLGEESAHSSSPNQDTLAQNVGWAVETMARYVPWDSRCLAQALAASWMLSRRNCDITLYFGVSKSTGSDFNAHAWLRCGDRIVTGGRVMEQFNVLAHFARKADGAHAMPSPSTNTNDK